MEKETLSYLSDACKYLAGNILYLIIPVLLTSCLYLSIYIQKGLDFYYIIGIYLSIAVIVPLYYGQFVEIITTGRKDNWKVIFEKYWVKIFIVSIILYLPSIILSFMFPQFKSLKTVLTLAIDILTIYVLPLVLLTNRIIGSIELGVKCLLGNIKFSLPFIVLITVMPIISSMISSIAKYTDTLVVMYSTSIFLIFISKFVNFLIFISAALVLRKKLTIIPIV